eukprot:157925-Amphidinium_carterae.6
MRATLSVWELTEWSIADDIGKRTLWLDHSIATWMTTTTQWHMNAYTAITMLNWRSMTVAFKQWCDNNGLTTIPALGAGRQDTQAAICHSRQWPRVRPQCIYVSAQLAHSDHEQWCCAADHRQWDAVAQSGDNHELTDHNARRPS